MGWFGPKKKKVLVIDDEVTTRTMIAMTLEEFEFEVHQASTGDMGIQMAEELGPDLILMDIMMPGMTGFDALAILRNNPKTRRTPIIMVTARQMMEDVERCLEAGANDYIQKPFDLMSLKTKVDKVLSS